MRRENSETVSKWNVQSSANREALIWLQDSDIEHYDTHTQLGRQETKALLPASGHTIEIDGEVFTVAMFHKLKCLDISVGSYA